MQRTFHHVLAGAVFLTATALTTPCAAQAGTLDLSFDPGYGVSGGFSPNVYAISLQPDGKIIIAGDFAFYDGAVRNHIARLNTDGSVDGTFHPGGGPAGVPGSPPPVVRSTAVQPDGKILIGGYFFWYNGSGCYHIARLNTDGSFDASFSSGSGAGGDVHAIAVQPDGRIIIGGSFISYDGVPCGRIVRVGPDGSLDNTFLGGVNGNGTINSIAIQPDGKILIGGYFTSYDGTPRNNIARLNADGTLDAAFNPGSGATGSGGVMSVAVQPDGKVVIGGLFNNYNGASRKYHARINPDGSLDTSFIPGIPSNPDPMQVDFVRRVVVQPDGKVIITGEFTYYNNVPRGCIARLNTDGSLDATFNPGTGAVWGINSTVLQPDGRILIGGHFTSYTGISRSKIARLLPGYHCPDLSADIGDPCDPGPGFVDGVVNYECGCVGTPTGVSVNGVDAGSAHLNLWPNPNDGSQLWVSFAAPGVTSATKVTVEIHDLGGKLVMAQRLSLQSGRALMDIGGVAAGTYMVRIADMHDLQHVERLVVQP